MFAKADEPDAASAVFVARENYVLRGCRTRYWLYANSRAATFNLGLLLEELRDVLRCH
jgi:hypothetical protein